MRKTKILSAMSFAAAMLAGTMAVEAAEPIEINIKGDLVSSYVCRGAYQAGPSFQPSIGVGYGGLSLNAWATTDFEGHATNDGTLSKEIDLTLKYDTRCGLSFFLTDYWLDCMGDVNFFLYNPHRTGHIFEASVAYALPSEKLPLSLRWNTLFAGNDYNFDGRRAYSSYVELGYTFGVRKMAVDLAVGAVPYKSQEIYGCDGFIVRNVSAKATYTVHACEGLDIPVFTKVVVNPHTEDMNLVFGISLVPTGL